MSIPLQNSFILWYYSTTHIAINADKAKIVTLETAQQSYVCMMKYVCSILIKGLNISFSNVGAKNK